VRAYCLKCLKVQAIRFSVPLSCCSSIRTLKTLVLTIHILLDRIASWRAGRGAIREGSSAFANAESSSTGATQANAYVANAASAESVYTLVPMLPQLRSHSALPEHHSAVPLFARGVRLWTWIPRFERMVVKYSVVDWLRRNRLLPRGTHSPTAFRFVLHDRTLREKFEERRRSSHLRLEPVRIKRPTTPK
jgi:hypothetical protein